MNEYPFTVTETTSTTVIRSMRTDDGELQLSKVVYSNVTAVETPDITDYNNAQNELQTKIDELVTQDKQQADEYKTEQRLVGTVGVAFGGLLGGLTASTIHREQHHTTAVDTVSGVLLGGALMSAALIGEIRFFSRVKSDHLEREHKANKFKIDLEKIREARENGSAPSSLE